MKKVDFSLVVHNHQPVDNADGIVESVYRSAYLPFVKTLSEFPQVNVNLHYSGYLIEWIERRHPELIRLLRSMADEGQVEFIGGGYYEPIISTIPDRDARGQFELESEKISSLFGREPRGAWAAERAWEPQLPELLRSCGAKYTLLDDTIFRRSGVTESDCWYPYLVESRGSVLTVFPMLKVLRYWIPWKSPSATVSYLRGAADGSEERIVVVGDDGEKFGAWPTTHELVYGKRWLENFFEQLTANRRWLNVVTLSQYLSGHGVHRRTYLPAAAYEEMMEWAIPHGSGEAAGGSNGFWRLFLAKYPESGRLYSKMLSVSEMVAALGGGNEEIRRELWKGQCNDAYWHGVFGGLYSPLLRRITYGHLSRAERMAEEKLHGRRAWLGVKAQRFDGYQEIAINTKSLTLRVCPERGGSIAEFGFKPTSVNLFDVLSRRRESYHSRITDRTRKSLDTQAKSIHDPMGAKEEGLHRLLRYDRYPRYSFLDYFLDPRTTIDQFSDQKFKELIPFACQPYSVRVRKGLRRVDLELSRDCNGPDRSVSATVLKRLSVSAADSAVRFKYLIRFAGRTPPHKFLLQINLGSLGDDRFTKEFSRTKSLSGTSTLRFNYPSLGSCAIFELDRNTDVWLIPILTVSKSESGFESHLQGVSVVPHFNVKDQGCEGGFVFEVRLSARRTG